MSESDAELLFFLQFARRQRLHAIASAAFLVWDLITTLDDEVEYIWGSANTLPKYLYFISRYFGLLGQLVVSTNLVPMFCFDYLVWSFGFLFTLILSVELSLMLRIDALYGKSRKVRVLMGFGFLAEIAFGFWLNLASYPAVARHLVEFPSVIPIRGCLLDHPIALYRLSWFPILAFETVLFLLNVAKCISHCPLENTPLIYRLFRDGSLYFTIIVVSMIGLTIAQYLNSEAAPPLVVWISVVFSYSGCHLLLSLRKIAARRQRLVTSQIFSADIPLVHAGSDATDSSSLGIDIHPLPSRLSTASRVRPSLQVNAETIELVPRRVSPFLATPSPSAEGSQEETACFDYTRNWDIVHPSSSGGDRLEHSRSRGGRSEDRDGGLQRLQRWNP
ncbi:hypothetical protein LXA43DRAFT_1024636 [Ganoderma leucocontextum]|nr:hypothetical protein LXA43DRAFT_1024636 [Ganoderma leucocontextum]